MKQVRICALILLIQTILWLVLMFLSTKEIESDWKSYDYVKWTASGGTIYVLNYINVSLLTIMVMFLFSSLYMHLRESAPAWTLAALVLVPVYGLLNLLAYTLQISLVPELATKALENEHMQAWVAQLIQANPGSLVGYANGLAYAILGVPSIINGRFLIRQGKPVSGWLLLLSGIFSLLGLGGILAGIALLSSGILLGGLVFLFSLAAMVWEFWPTGPKD